MIDCRYCEATNFESIEERDSHESTCWIKRMDDADQQADVEERGSVVTITGPKGVLSPQAADVFLKALRKGVFYLAQGR